MRSIIVLPEDSAKPILDAIHRAERSLRIKMFVFSDPALLNAVIAAHTRGVNVRVMLNPERRDGEEENKESRIALINAGIEVIDSNPFFDLTHNWQTENLTTTRDYAIVTSHKHEVDEVIQGFEADWHRTPFTPGDHSHLIWCIGNGRQRIGQLIDSAKHSLWLQNERYQDPTIIEHLVRAHTRGVTIHLMARPPHKLKKDKLVEGVSGLRILQDLGVKIHKLKHIKLHAKLILADDARAIIGSINLAPGSFDSRRELAIEVDDEHIIQRIRQILNHDWENSKPLDLTDAGLFAELKEYDPNVAEDLALDTSHPARHH
jgi:cardiolipin synthase A/B